MAYINNSYKKVYENKNIHIGLFIVAFLWTVCSMLFDAATGRPANYRQNIFDVLFGLFVGAHSLQFLHNAINNINSGVVPDFREIKGKIYWDMIRLDIVWALYAAVIIMASVVLYMTLIDAIILPVIVIILTAFAGIFVYYIYLAYAENLETKGLFNIALVFKFIQPAFKDIIIKLCLFILLTLFAFIISVLIYVAAAITGIDKIGNIAGDYYAADFIVISITAYFMLVTWYFAFPYSLIDTYIEKIRPLLRKEEADGENV